MHLTLGYLCACAGSCCIFADGLNFCGTSASQEAASSPLPYKDLEAMAAHVNGPAADDTASAPQDQAAEQAPSLQASPAPSSVDMELTGGAVISSQ